MNENILNNSNNTTNNINPNVDKEPQRYSNMARTRRSLNSPNKSNTITFIVVIALLGISVFGFILLSRSNKNEDEDTENYDNTPESSQTSILTTTSTTQTNDDEETENENIDVTEKSDDNDAEESPSDEDFKKDNQTIGSESVTEVKITEFKQEGFENFIRIIFTVDSKSEFPYTTASLVTGSNLISLKIKGISEDKSGITRGTGSDVTGSVVSTIFHEVTSEAGLSWYKIGVKVETSFYLHTMDNPKRIVLDVKEQTVENGNGTEFNFSKEAQTITGDASGNVISVVRLSHSDQPSEGIFRIILGLGTIGTGSIPNVNASIVDYTGGKAIKLEISNLYSDFASQGNYNQTYGNRAVSGMEGSYSSNTSTYYIRLTSEREYKLYYRKAPAQIIVDVKS